MDISQISSEPTVDSIIREKQLNGFLGWTELLQSANAAFDALRAANVGVSKPDNQFDLVYAVWLPLEHLRLEILHKMQQLRRKFHIKHEDLKARFVETETEEVPEKKRKVVSGKSEKKETPAPDAELTQPAEDNVVAVTAA